ncbi:MAG: hypothetical protein V4677_06020 [Bacteroidota bacterium]
MKAISIKLACILTVLITLCVSCERDGNTGNGSVDTPVKVGSGYSDSLDPEKGELDTRQTPDESKKGYEDNKR